MSVDQRIVPPDDCLVLADSFFTAVYQTPNQTPQVGNGHNRQQDPDSACWETPRYTEQFSLSLFGSATPDTLRPYPAQTPHEEPSGGAAKRPRPISIEGPPLRQTTAPTASSGLAANLHALSELQPPLQQPPLQQHSPPQHSLQQAAAAVGCQPPSPHPSKVSDPNGSNLKFESPSHKPSAKRSRKGSLVATPPAHFATPPPSSDKGGHKPAAPGATMDPHLDPVVDDATFASSHHDHLSVLMANGGDMFVYPLSAPVTGPGNFWGPPQPTMAPMDLDMSVMQPHMYPATAHPDHASSFGWHPDTHSFSQPASEPIHEPAHEPASEPLPPQPQNNPKKKSAKPRPLAPKKTTTAAARTQTSTNSTTAANATSAFDLAHSEIETFALGNLVNPGLVFPRSGSLDPSGHLFGALSPGLIQALPSSAGGGRSPILPAPILGSSVPTEAPRPRGRASSPAKAGPPGSLRRSATNPAPRKKKGPLQSGSVKAVQARPPKERASVPALARPPTVQPSGRNSPLKMEAPSTSSVGFSHAHHMPPPPAPPAPVPKGFTLELRIDERGRAYTEAKMVSFARRSDSSVRSAQLHESPAQVLDDYEDDDDDDDESSSSDDEPIMIPSRTSSFALPDTLHAAPFMARNDHGTPSSAAYSDMRPSSSSVHSKAETMTTDEQGCDAASELAKMVEMRQQKPAPRKSRPSTAVAPTRAKTVQATVLFASNAHVRCICHQTDDRGYFMVQCKSCDLWLHGNCINMTTRGTQTAMYICAFCANTPHAHAPVPAGRRASSLASSSSGGSAPRAGAGASGAGGVGPGTSTLPHKTSFKTFR